MEADPPPIQRGPIQRVRRKLWLSLLLWLPSLLLLGAFLLYREDPVLLGSWIARIGQFVHIGKTILLFGVLPLGLLALLLYPPFLPWLRLAWEKLRKKGLFDRKQAADLLTRLKNFETVPDLLQLGRLYLDSGQVGMALPPLAKALEKEPDSARTHFLIARAFDEIGRPAQALPHAMAAVHKMEGSFGKADAQLLLAKTLFRLGKLEDSLAQVEKLIQESGESYESLFLQAQILKLLDRSQESKAAFAKILRLGQGKKRRDPRQDWILAKARMALLIGNGTFLGKDQ